MWKIKLLKILGNFLDELRKVFKQSPKKVFRVYIAWYKDDKGWENSRKLCKPETKTRVCITVQSKPIPIYWNSYLAARKLFFTPFFSRLFRLSLAPTICPWVYEDARLWRIEQKRWPWGSIRMIHFYCFYSPKPQSQVWILIYRLISQPFECLH